MVFPHQEFEKTSCKDANIDKGYLADMFDFIQKQRMNIHSMLLVKDGLKVFDAYAYDYEPFANEEIYSISKSFTSVAIGICIDKGLLKLDDIVIDYFKKELTHFKQDYENLKLSDFLSMKIYQQNDVSSSMQTSKNPFEVFFNEEIVAHDEFQYNNGVSFILSALVTKVTKQSCNDFLDEHMYQIIGMKKPVWKSVGIYSLGATGLQTNTIDLAKFGLLLLNDGSWNGKTVVSKAYLEEATKVHVTTDQSGNPADRYGYGYQFWMNEFGDFRCAGWHKQYIVVNKKYNVVFVTQAYEDREVLDLFSNYILPALEKGWLYDSVTLRDYIHRFKEESQELIEFEKKNRVD